MKKYIISFVLLIFPLLTFGNINLESNEANISNDLEIRFELDSRSTPSLAEIKQIKFIINDIISRAEDQGLSSVRSSLKVYITTDLIKGKLGLIEKSVEMGDEGIFISTQASEDSIERKLLTIFKTYNSSNSNFLYYRIGEPTLEEIQQGIKRVTAIVDSIKASGYTLKRKKAHIAIYSNEFKDYNDRKYIYSTRRTINDELTEFLFISLKAPTEIVERRLLGKYFQEN